MFTGLIEEIGTITSISNFGDGKKIIIKCSKILSDTKIDDSISINGICQTVTNITENSFEFISVEETLKKTTIKNWKQNDQVNLERAIRFSDRLGGHILSGHIDCVGSISKIIRLSASTIFEIEIDNNLKKYVIPQGSIAIDGISLTISDIKQNKISVAIIPHTIQNTILKLLNTGDTVNLEFDLIGKYIENFLKYSKEKNDISLDKLKEWGY